MNTLLKKDTESQLMQLLPYIGVVVCLGLAMGSYLLIFRPMLGSMMPGGELDLEPLTARLNDDTAYLSKADASLESYREIALDAKQKVSLALPSEEDVPGLFVQMDEVVRTNNMVLMSVSVVKPAVSTTKKAVATALPKGVKSVSVSLDVSGGTYADFTRMLEQLESLVRIADVKQVSFGSTPSFSITLDVYMLDASSVVQPAPVAAVPVGTEEGAVPAAGAGTP